jgi:type IV pilus assembly protein PilM
MPSMNAEELRSATRFEAEKVIPYSIEDVELDSFKAEDLAGNRMRVVIIAAKKDLIDSELKLVYEAGLEPSILDVDSFALMNAFVNSQTDIENVSALVNIGAKKTNLNIIKGACTYLSRDIDIGSANIDKMLSETLSIPEVEAQRIREEKLSKFSELTEPEKKSLEAPLADVLNRLSDEVRLSFDFYENHYANSVKKIYISGGMTVAPVVLEYLKELLGQEASKWDPLANITVHERISNKDMLQRIKPQLAVAIGLGLRKE